MDVKVTTFIKETRALLQKRENQYVSDLKLLRKALSKTRKSTLKQLSREDADYRILQRLYVTNIHFLEVSRKDNLMLSLILAILNGVVRSLEKDVFPVTNRLKVLRQGITIARPQVKTLKRNAKKSEQLQQQYSKLLEMEAIQRKVYS